MDEYQKILEKIKSVSKECGVEAPQLMAVSKVQPIEKIKTLYDRGQRIFGENYVQELLEKYEKLKFDCPEIQFHFIGHLQTNKVKSLLPAITAIHSVDSLKLLQEIGSRAQALGKTIQIYLQVNVDEEESKGGFKVSEMSAVAEWVKSHPAPQLNFRGLMAIPDPEKNLSQAFRVMRALSEQWSSILGSGLSMGMSSDFEEAIRNGSSMIRIGTALFGVRGSNYTAK